MPFVPAKRAVAAIPVTAQVYDENGKPVSVSFVAKYRRHAREEVQSLNDSVINLVRQARGSEPVQQPDGSTPPEWPYEADEEFLADVVVGWGDMKAPDGSDLPFSQEALLEMLDDYPELIAPLFRGFFDAHRGIREKN